LKFVILSVIFLFFIQCHRNNQPIEEEPEEVLDPPGTIQFNLLKSALGQEMFTPPGFSTGIGLDINNKLVGCYFLEFGKVKCIGEITQIPDKPPVYWSIQEVKKGYGYIGVYTSTRDSWFFDASDTISATYFRLYVEDYIIKSEEVVGYIMKFHSPFNSKQTATEITVDKTEISGEFCRGFFGWITIMEPMVSWRAIRTEKWCGTIAYRNMIYVDVPPCYDYWEDWYHGDPTEFYGTKATITIQMEGYPDKIITVTRTGPK